MTRFGDLMKGIPVEVPTVVETPVVEIPAPVVEEPPKPEEEVADVIAPSVSFDAMSKDELEDYGRTVGIELDRRHSKKKLIQQLEDHIQYIESI